MYLQFILIFLSGLIAGVINILAGGGSLLTLPALIFSGLPASIANGTNRLALLVGGLSGVSRFRKSGYFEPKLGLKLAIPTTVGAIAGSFIAVDIPDEIFKPIFATVMLIILAFMLFRPDFEKNDKPKRVIPYWVQCIAFIILGLYGGIIQAGVGILAMALLAAVIPSKLTRINSLKNFIVTFYIIFSVVIFVIHGKIDWIAALVLSLGNFTGAFIGTHIATKKGELWVKIALAIIVLAMSLKLFNVFSL